MKLGDFRAETAHLPNDTEMLIDAVVERLVPCAWYTRADVDKRDEIYPKLTGAEIIISEAV